MASILENPSGAFGQPPSHYRQVTLCPASAAITRGQLCLLTFSATTGIVSAAPTGTTDDLDKLYGVADEDIGSGATGKIVTGGFAWAAVGAGTVADGDGMIRSGATAGLPAPVTPDATTVAGQTAGTFLGVKGSASPYPFANAALVWVNKF